MPTIAQPTPASGLLIRRPVIKVYVDGTLLPFVLDATTTRGLDQEVGSCDITYPHPLPDFVRTWSEVRVLMGVNVPYNPAQPDQGLKERFVGFVINVGASLYPGAHTIHCEDKLAMAKYTYTPEAMSLAGDTDVQAIIRILSPPAASNAGGVGLGVTTADIKGLNVQLTDFDDVTLVWDVGQTALEVIQQIDSASMGYRTYCDAGGRVKRTLVPTDPNTQGAFWQFAEGVDILDGSEQSEIKDAKNEITVTGFDATWRATLTADEDPFDWRHNSYWIHFAWLRDHVGGGFLNPTQVAEYILSQLNKNILKVTFSTHLMMLFNGVEVIKITSPKLEVDQKFWVQSVQTSWAATGAMTQNITAVSELQESTNRGVVTPPVITPTTVPPGSTVILPATPTPTAPSGNDILVDFSLVSVDQEFAADPGDTDATGTIYYTIHLAATASSRQGYITDLAWAADGPGCLIAEGSGDTFTTAFTQLDTATITLTATDSNGSTNSITRPAWDRSTPIRARKLYACTPELYFANDGTAWRSHAPASGNVRVCAAGPVWATDTGIVAVSNDDLATPPQEMSTGIGDVTAIWLHETNAQYIVVGASSGQMAVSKDRGLTWTPKGGPGGRINFVISSIFHASEWHVVTPSGWFKSDNEGTSWSRVKEGSFIYLELAPVRNIVVTTAGVLQQGETGTPFTGNTSPIVAATAHIRSDRFYAIAEDGTTWYTANPGDFALVAGAPIPAGNPYPAGSYRDGQVVDLVYFAAQTGGLFKTLDGFKTSAAYLRLMSIGRLTP